MNLRTYVYPVLLFAREFIREFKMLLLRRSTKYTVNDYIKKYIRFCGQQTLNSSPDENVHNKYQSEWKLAQERYAKHPLIVYSTKLEEQVEFMNYRRLRTYKFKEALKERRKWHQLQKQPLISEPEVSFDIETDTSNFPVDWMEDYEFYEGNRDGNHSTYGTADPRLSPSNVPCSGCGAHLHCTHTNLPGFIPVEIFKGRSKKELQSIICQRCHFLKNYNIALDVEISADSYVETISRIKDEYALAIVIVDLLDFPCSIWPGLHDVLGHKRPVFVVGNKVDLLPRDHNNYLDHVKSCLKDQMVQCQFDSLNIKHISLISAKTGYGIEELITQLHKIWAYKGNVYLVGCTNVGKSSLFNILLNSDYCRPEASNLVRRATTCPWPGTTLQMLKFPIYRPSEIRVYQRFRRLTSERAKKDAKNSLRRQQAQKTGDFKAARLEGAVGRTFVDNVDTADAFAMSSGTQPISTLNEKDQLYRQAKWCYDTPGVMHPQQFTELLTSEELQKLTPNDMIVPRAVQLKPGMSIFLAGLARLDFIDCKYVDIDWVKVIVFSSLQLPLVVSHTANAAQAYKEYFNTEILGLPHGDETRLARWPGLQCSDKTIELVGKYQDAISSEIVLSSAGWVGLGLPYASECRFQAWTPFARGIYVRSPPLVPYAERLLGKRIRNSLAYNLGKPFIFKK
ncbi:nitric oxide-associated protein 1 [Anastrepha obliqua]|uniref:nitric oxide-associated protein 1 n=1 Tax=Anastrepha obliqua TaxID=95512 RepID=UPI00240A610D|nr:nitric oxide-associated protein 1 [Anastrepha obliqua]